MSLWQVNLVEWLKMMVGSRRTEDVVDPDLETKPATRALKRALLVALRCVDPDSVKRPKMSQVVRMLEADDFPYREVLINFPPSLMFSILCVSFLLNYISLLFNLTFWHNKMNECTLRKAKSNTDRTNPLCSLEHSSRGLSHSSTC